MTMLREIENWGKENPFRVAFIVYGILEALTYLKDLAKGVDYSPILEIIANFLQVNVTIKAWHIFTLLGTLFFINLIYPKVKNWVPLSLKRPRKPKFVENSKIVLALPPLNESIDSQFLDNEFGTFSIWAQVTDFHNHVHGRVRFMYIIGRASNKGADNWAANDRSLVRYPNAWAIQRMIPTSNDAGRWRFWCNGIGLDKDKTTLDYIGNLFPGWHLFSIAWSKADDYIKFIIDLQVVAEENFLNWPTEFSEPMVLGSWPTKSRDHFFDAKICPWRFTRSPYSEKVILDYFVKKPKA